MSGSRRTRTIKGAKASAAPTALPPARADALAAPVAADAGTGFDFSSVRSFPAAPDESAGERDAEARASQALSRPGPSMAAGWRGFFEARFGTSFTDVRLRADAPAARTAAALGAHAFTLGRDIYFAGGQLAPATPAGTHLLAHEPAHVAPAAHGLSQQSSGSFSRSFGYPDFGPTRCTSEQPRTCPMTWPQPGKMHASGAAPRTAPHPATVAPRSMRRWWYGRILRNSMEVAFANAFLPNVLAHCTGWNREQRACEQ